MHTSHTMIVRWLSQGVLRPVIAAPHGAMPDATVGREFANVVVTAAASDGRTLHTLRSDPVTAIGVVVRLSLHRRLLIVVRDRACDLQEAVAW